MSPARTVKGAARKAKAAPRSPASAPKTPKGLPEKPKASRRSEKATSREAKAPASKSKETASPTTVSPSTPVGGYLLGEGDIAFNADRLKVSLEVRNTGDRPVQVGSHFHFFEANRALAFDRERAYGMHLDIPSSTAIRFEPGDERTVPLVAYGGLRRVHGFNNLVDGDTHDAASTKPGALRRMRDRGFKSR